MTDRQQPMILCAGWTGLQTGVGRWIVVAIIVVAAATLVIGDELVNEYCPVTTSELAEAQFSIDYQGQSIYFCCNKCKKDFMVNPEAYLANVKLQDSESDTLTPPHDHSEGHADEETHGSRESVEAGPSPTSHDHGSDHGDSSSLTGFAGKFHPMLTHFPIALVLAALFFSVLAAVLNKQTLEHASVYSVYLAAITGVGTVLLGLAAGASAQYPTFLVGYLDWHRVLGITTGILTLITACSGNRLLAHPSTKTVWTYRMLLLLNAVLVGVTGHFGATLVFGPDHFSFGSS